MVALFVVTAGIIVIVVAAVSRVWTEYSDPALRWTAVGGALAGGAFLTAILGVPAAVYQLLTVEQEVARFTTVTEAEKKLLRQLDRGLVVAELVHAGPDGGSLLDYAVETLQDEDAPTDFQDWVDQTAGVIAEIADETEVRLFRFTARRVQPADQIGPKISYLRNDLWPKVRAGYWAETGKAKSELAKPKDRKG